MPTQPINKFNSIKEWKDYCFNTHILYLKSPHFKKWINKKEIYIFNLSDLKNKDIDAIKSGMRDAAKAAELHFKIEDSKNLIEAHAQIDFSAPKINSKNLLKMVVKERKQNHKEHANIFVFNNPIKSQDSVIEDGEALTYVPEGITFFSFGAFKKYPHSFLMRRGKHEALHLLGLNSHHEDTEVKGYKHVDSCIMEYNAPTIKICKKCSDAIKSFWKGIRHAVAKNT